MTSTLPAAPPVLGEWQPIQRLPQAPAQPAPRSTPRGPMARAGSWLRTSGLGIVGFTLVLVVACSGWAASFIGLHDFGHTHMGLSAHTAWLVPLTFDGAPLGLTLVVYRASINGRGATVWRALIMVFTGLSSWINWQHIDDPTGRWIASYMPPSAVILFEGLMSEARAAASERPRLHPLRWFIDRKGTWAMYRAYVLGIEVPAHLKKTTEKPAPERSGERPQDDTGPLTLPVPERAQHADTSAPTERPPRAHSERPTKPKSERRERPKRAPKTSAPKRGGKGQTERRRERARALYDELGRRPEWTEIRDVLVDDKLAPADISRPTVQRIRDAVEKQEPALTALGTDNVRPLPKTGS